MRSRKPRKENGGFLLALIVWERAIVGTLLILVGVGLFSLVDRDVGGLARKLVRTLNLDVDNQYLQYFLNRLDLLNGPIILRLSAGTLLFGTLGWIQALGLYYKRRWAEYLTAVSVGLFVPFEIYHFHQRWNELRFMGVALNILIVVYLVDRLRRGK
jgi:uncharacterized membrane protein (DUF2068 family)